MRTHSTLPPVEVTAKAIDALLAAIDGAPTIGAVTAYKAALRRHGSNLLATAGPDALPAMLARVRAEAPDVAAAQDRERMLALAWDGLGRETAA